jgi:hypothetical protein
MYTVDLLKKNVKGVEGSFLMKEGEIIECDLDKEGLDYLSKSILFLVESFLKSRKDLKKITIAANNYFIVFFYENYVLGAVVSKDTNFPLLNIVSNKLLFTVEEHPEKQKEVVEEAVDEVMQRMDAFVR